MGKYTWIMLINAVIMAVAMIVISHFVDDSWPFISGLGMLNLLNIIFFGNLDRKKRNKK